MTRTILMNMATHSVLMLYGEDGFPIAYAISEIYPGAYPYERRDK